MSGEHSVEKLSLILSPLRRGAKTAFRIWRENVSRIGNRDTVTRYLRFSEEKGYVIASRRANRQGGIYFVLTPEGYTLLDLLSRSAQTVPSTQVHQKPVSIGEVDAGRQIHVRSDLPATSL